METSWANTQAHQDGWQVVIAGEADVAISQLKAND